jgi:hypothetical protein
VAAPPASGLVAGIGNLPGTGSLGAPVPPRRAFPPPGQAGGDAFAFQGGIGLPGQAALSLTLGPVAPTSASASSPGRPTSRSSAAGCGAGAAPCPAGVDQVSLGGSSTVATVETGQRADCGAGAPPAGFETGPLTPPAAAACTSGLRVVALGPLGLVADGVAAESVTQGCSLAPVGRASVRDLALGGLHLAGGPAALAPGTRRTVRLAGVPTAMVVVLDEQMPDPSGRGLTVNAIHISGGAVDLVIGHVHSAAGCGGGTGRAAPAGAPGLPPASLPPALAPRRVGLG